MMHAPRLLAHGDHAAARGFCRSEVDVGELGEGVADVVVDGALAHLAALDVGDGNAQGERDGCGSEHLVAVGDQQQQVGAPGGKGVGQPEDGDADGLGHTGIGVGTKQALDARLDGESVAFDLGDSHAEFGREMRAEGKDTQVDFRPGGQFAEGPVKVTIICARGGDHADAPLAGLYIIHREFVSLPAF